MKATIYNQSSEPVSSIEPLLKKIDTDKPYLKGKYLLITGATQGIGEILSIVAAACGANVILLDNTLPALERIFQQICSIDNAPEPLLLPVDLGGAQLKHYAAMHDQLAEIIPQLDGIIHNAAHFDGLYALLQTPPNTLVQQMHTNYTAPILITQALLPLLIKSDEPTLLFADHSESHGEDTAYWNSYAASKIALMQAVKQMALENNHYPLVAYGYNTGWVNTQLARAAYPNANPAWPTTHEQPDIASQILSLFLREAPSGSIIDVR